MGNVQLHGDVTTLNDHFLFFPLPPFVLGSILVPPDNVNPPHAHTQRKLFISRVALSGMSEDSWTEESERALDKFITDTTISTMVVYLDSHIGLRVEYVMPSQVQHTHSFPGQMQFVGCRVLHRQTASEPRCDVCY